MKKKNIKLTGEELFSEIMNYEWFRESIKGRSDEQRTRVETNIKESAPLIGELREMGYDICTVADLFNLKLEYSSAIPVLVEWLPRMENLDVKTDIIRALAAVAQSDLNLAPIFIEEFRKLPPEVDTEGSGIRWALANGIKVAATNTEYEDIVQLLEDRSNGYSRQMLTLSLANMKDPRVADELLNLLDDDLVCGHAVMALGKIKVEKARSAIEPFLNHEKAWIRGEAIKAIQRIDRKATKGGE